jgi:transposase-like protein
MSRPPEGVGHVERLEGPEDVKRRLRVLMETLVGRKSVVEACEELGISESRLHEMRREALVGALGALMPKPSGRPARVEPTTTRERELQEQIGELEVDLQAALVRTELALAMPDLFRRGSKKNPRGRKAPVPTKPRTPPVKGD